MGKGTTFKIYLPRVDDAHEQAAAALGAAQIPRGSETILLVEDEDQVREIAREMLIALGYKVLSAEHGARGLALAEQFPGTIHLTITDVVMPQLSGREMIEHLSLVRPNMKVLYMSGYTDDAIVRHRLLDKHTEFMQKPFATEAFAQKIRKLLDSPLNPGEQPVLPTTRRGPAR